MTGQIKILMHLELKVMNRYIKPAWLVAFFWTLILLWYVLDSPKQKPLSINAPVIMTVLVLSTAAMYSQDFFWAGQNSPMFRYFYAIDFRKMLMVKNLFLIAMTFGMVVPVYISAGFVLGVPSIQILNATVFYWMAIFSVLSLGNSFTVRNRSRKSSAPGFAMLLQTGVVFACAAVPYLVFIGIIQSYLAGGVFSVLVGVIWYLVSLPVTARRLYLNKYQILEEV